MANPEHLEIVKQGAAALERSFIEHVEKRLEHLEGWLLLEGADFHDADLRDVAGFFGYADFRDANLRGADLTKACFDCTDLRGANLSGATSDEHPFSLACCDRFSDIDGVILSDIAR